MNLSQKINTRFSLKLRDKIQEIANLGKAHHRRVVLVGGLVRDLIMNRPLVDVDIMVDYPAGHLAQAIAKQFNAKLVSHERFHTFSVQPSSGDKLDIVTAREEVYAKPAQLPDVTPSTIEKDLKRRDFTINAMSCWLSGGEFGDVLDPFEGQSDIKEKKIRALHEKSFIDDPTRIFRAARFASRFNFDVEENTMEWIEFSLGTKKPSLLSPVRLRNEFLLIFKEANPLNAIELLQKWGALKFIHPDWQVLDVHREKMKDFTQKIEGKDLPKRLVAWFGPWQGKSEAMMTLLGFERNMKKEILGNLK